MYLWKIDAKTIKTLYLKWNLLSKCILFLDYNNNNNNDKFSHIFIGSRVMLS